MKKTRLKYPLPVCTLAGIMVVSEVIKSDHQRRDYARWTLIGYVLALLGARWMSNMAC